MSGDGWIHLIEEVDCRPTWEIDCAKGFFSDLQDSPVFMWTSSNCVVCRWDVRMVEAFTPGITHRDHSRSL